MNKKIALFFKEFSGEKLESLGCKKNFSDLEMEALIKKDFGEGLSYFIYFHTVIIVFFESPSISTVLVYNRKKELLNKIEIKPETTYKKLKLELKNVLNHIKKSNTDLKNAFYKHLMK